MKKILFIDRDGTILREPPDEQIDNVEKMEFLPAVITTLSKIAKELDYELVLVTNQDGLGTASFPEKKFWPVQKLMLNILKSAGIEFSNIHIDKSFAHENLPTRKPGTGMLKEYSDNKFDLKNSFVIGDRKTDIQLARNLNAKAIFIGKKSPGKKESGTYFVNGWDEIYSIVKSDCRMATVHRQTNETDITVELNIDGSGKSNISTGIGFLDHLLDQMSKHGRIDLYVSAKGDLHIDEHHTIEDIGLALGEAVSRALGSKKGIQRYGFLLPMDDCLAQAAIDFSGRSWLVWKARFTREKIGEMPTEMFSHFFKSFCDAAKCNLNIKAEGENEHHKIEAVFKAFAKAFRMAVAFSGYHDLPTTKGKL